MPSRRTSSLRGNAFQDEIEDFFFKRGCVVHNQKPCAQRVWTPKGPIYVSRRNDLFGAYDLMITDSESPVILIQATLHTGIGAKKRPIDTLPYNRHISAQIWQKIPYKGVRILVRTEKGWNDLGVLNLLKVEREADLYFQNM